VFARFPHTVESLLGVWLLVVMSSVSAKADEQFSLEIPNQPRQRSTAILSSRELLIVDGEGQRHSYARRPELDTPDNDYWAFYSATARRYLRWPAAGQGRMYLGMLQGDAVTWTASRMEVRRVGGDPVPGRPPIGRPPVGRPPIGRPPVAPGRPVDDLGSDDAADLGGGPLAAITGVDGAVTVARVDGRGRIDGFEVEGDDWRPWRSDDSPILSPGSALALTRLTEERRATVYAFDSRGELLVWRDAGRPRPLPPPRGADFIPGQRLAALDVGDRVVVLAVDQAGRLWSVEPDSRDWVAVEEREALLPPGAAIGMLQDDEPRALIVDRRGHLLEYRVASRGSRVPRRIASRLTPGSDVAVWSGRDSRTGRGEHRIAAVDNSGRLGIWSSDRSSWHQEVYRDLALPPGAPLALGRRGGQWLLSAVQSDGRWGAWTLGNDGWLAEPILDGFMGGGPVVSAAGGAVFCAVDRVGRIVAARRVQNRWNSVLLARHYALAPRLIQREVVSSPALPPADVVFVNRHSEELVVRLFDHARGDAPREIVIAPGKSTRVKLDRDAGATLTEVFLAPTPGGGFHEEVREIHLPPASRYTANVWVNRVTSVYFDRTTNKGPEPDEVNQSLVSLGVFPLPPGDQLDSGQRVDVYREATARRNPGEVRLLEPDPQP
jgi:hypothetical protein